MNVTVKSSVKLCDTCWQVFANETVLSNESSSFGARDCERHGQAGAVVIERRGPHVHHAQHVLERPPLAVLVLGHVHGQLDLLAPALARVPISNRAAHAASPNFAVVGSLVHARDMAEQRKQVRWDASTHRHSFESCGLSHWCRPMNDSRGQSQQIWLLL